MFLGNLQQFLKVPRLPHQTVRMIHHNMPDPPVPGHLQKTVPAGPLPVSLPRRTVRVNQHMPRYQAQAFHNVTANAFLPVHAGLILILDMRHPAVDRSTFPLPRLPATLLLLAGRHTGHRPLARLRRLTLRISRCSSLDYTRAYDHRVTIVRLIRAAGRPSGRSRPDRWPGGFPDRTVVPAPAGVPAPAVVGGYVVVPGCSRCRRFIDHGCAAQARPAGRGCLCRGGRRGRRGPGAGPWCRAPRRLSAPSPGW